MKVLRAVERRVAGQGGPDRGHTRLATRGQQVKLVLIFKGFTISVSKPVTATGHPAGQALFGSACPDVKQTVESASRFVLQFEAVKGCVARSLATPGDILFPTLLT